MSKKFFLGNKSNGKDEAELRRRIGSAFDCCSICSGRLSRAKVDQYGAGCNQKASATAPVSDDRG